MKEISSEQLQNREPIKFGNETGTLDLYDGLTTPFSADVVTLSDRHKHQLEAFAEIAATNYSQEATRVNREFGLPSLVVRVDCTIDEEGNIRPYEMEDSPSGQGIADKLHRASGEPGIKETILGHFEQIVGQPPVVVISSSRNHGTDDSIIVGSQRYVGPKDDHSILPRGPVIVKAIPGDVKSRLPYMGMQAQAIAPLETEGDKTYAEKMGLLACISSSTDLIRDENDELLSQVIKARLGSMAMGVSIYLNPLDRKRFGKSGIITAGRLVRDLEEYEEHCGGVLLQKFLPPIQIENNEGRANAILRVFTLLKREDGQINARAIGGCYVARKEVLLHGASNAVNGAVLV